MDRVLALASYPRRDSRKLNSAIYLGSGIFGAHGYTRATPTEREHYRVPHEQYDARQARSHTDLSNLQHAVGEKVAARTLDLHPRTAIPMGTKFFFD